FDPFAHYLAHLDRTSAYRPHAPLPPKKNPAPAPQPQREEPIPESDLDFVFMKEKGDFWRVRMSDSETLVSDCKGLTYIHYLLRHEGDWVSSMQLLAATDPEAVEMEDRRRREQRQRIRDAQADARESLSYLSGSSSSYDSDELQQAKEFYEEELRDVQDQIKAFHKNVYNRISNNIRRSLENFEKALPELAQHLSDTIKYRGQEWLYNPPSGEQIDWTLG
ncbi:MAG: hypothetical protein O3A46_07245, partial [Candidatus Poribacteria bacterium]|nr:hypothetical protein [Candidatus Poribacteria bacterium]